VKSLPYAPYIMHVIEQVSGIWFPTDAQHKLLKLANKMSILAARELKRAAKIAKGRGKGVSTSRSSRGGASPSASPSRWTMLC
jgi:hypothetical protein